MVNESPSPSRWGRAAQLLGASAIVMGCGGAAVSPDAQSLRDASDVGSTIAPASDSDRAVLAALGRLPTGQPQQLGHVTATAAAPYFAASGKECRRVSFAPAQRAAASGEAQAPDPQPAAQLPTATHRLACHPRGEPWHFVPDVLASTHHSPTPR